VPGRGAGITTHPELLNARSGRTDAEIGREMVLALHSWTQSLIDVAGAADLEGQLPSDVQSALATIGRLELKAINLTLAEGLSIKQAGVAVALPNIDTNVLPGFTVNDLHTGLHGKSGAIQFIKSFLLPI
jgi:hypothetical protein